MIESSKILVDLLQDGREDAAVEIFDRYMGRLVAMTRNRLSAKLGRRVDAEDIVQSAFRSFFRRAGAGEYEFNQSGDLWRLLTVITLNKLRRKAEHHSAAKRDFGNEAHADPTKSFAFEAVSNNPTPEAEVELAEELDIITEGMSAEHRRIVELRLQGYKLEEIASDLDCSERTVRRVIDRFRERLETRIESLESDQ